MMVSQQEILDQLSALKNKDRPYLQPRDYKAFLPSAVPNVNQGADTSVFGQQAQSIVDRAKSETALAQTKQQNVSDFNQMLKAQQALKKAQETLKASQHLPQLQHLKKKVPGGNVRVMATQGKNAVQQPQRGSVTAVGAPVAKGSPTNVSTTNVKGFHDKYGHTMALNPSVGNRFVGFLNALQGQGYKINSLGTHVIRNQANGSGQLSLHSYGLAADINPDQNPYSQANHLVTNLPKGVGQLAAKYGLVWGGAWKHSKDAMHFSVPWGGRE